MMNVHGSAAAAFVLAQSGAPSARLETKSATPDALPAADGTAKALAPVVAGLVPAGREQDLADALVACVDACALRLTRIDPSWRPLAYRLPPQAWTLLDRLAAEGGLTHVDVPQADCSEDIPGLARGLAVLPSLQVLDLPVPRSGPAIDLSALRAAGRPQELHLHCVRADAWQVTVPECCRVHAGGPVARQQHLLKPTVSYVDTRGQPTGERHALAGVPYLAKPPASLIAASKGDAKAARRRALGLSTNGQAQFVDEVPVAEGLSADRTIWCRHIAWKVADDWRERRGLQQVGMPAKMSYEPYATPEALRAHVKPETQANYRRELAREAAALFTDSGFGEALQAQFESLTPGSERIFLLITQGHAMTLELRRKGRHFIVTCYDPNVSAVPLKLLVSDPSHLKVYSLSSLLAAGAHGYMPLAARVCGALFAFGADAAHTAGPARLHGFGEDLVASREGIFWFLYCGVTSRVDAAVEAIVAANRDRPPQLLMARLSTLQEGHSGLVDAVARQRTGTADAYVHAVLRHALPVLGADRTAYLLTCTPQADGSTALNVALEMNQDFIAAYVRRVLAVPGLDAESRVGLLTLPNGRALVEEALDYLPVGQGDADLPPRLQALVSILSAVLGAPGLDAAARLAVLAGLAGASPWTHPFVQRIEAGDPVPAALLLSACLSPDSDDAIPPESLDPSLQVDAVLAALRAQPENPLARRCAQWLASDREMRDEALKPG